MISEILKWPTDILLHMLSFCMLEECLSFSMICKEMYSLAFQKAFWITALKNERQIKPIACPYREDLTLHEIPALKRIALHTRRLERNWASETPQVIGQIKTLSLGFPMLEFLFQVPGTELYVFHCSIRETVELWHIGLGRIVGGPLTLSAEVCDISQPEDLPGKLTFALLVTKESAENPSCAQITLLSVEYAQDHFALTIPCIYDLPVPANVYTAVFLDNDIVGALCDSGDEMSFCVTAMNRTTHNHSFIVTDLQVEAASSLGTTIVDGYICILVENSSAYMVPNSLLPRDDNPGCPSMSMFQFEGASFDPPPQASGVVTTFFGMMTVNSPFGVQAMAIHLTAPLIDPEVPNTVEITFWTRKDSEGAEGHRLVPVSCESMPGAFRLPRELSVQTLSGRKGLMWLDDDSHVLCLAGCDGHKTTIRDLVIPDIVDLANVHDLFLDDHLGVVSLIDKGGVLYTIPYA